MVDRNYEMGATVIFELLHLVEFLETKKSTVLLYIT